jgi:hypothetical protein
LGDFAETLSLNNRAGGSVSGELKLAARGSDRAALAASLHGQGLLRAREASFGRLDVTPPAAGPANPGAEIQSAASASALNARFQIASGRVQFEQSLFTQPSGQTEITGTLDFAGRLDLHARSLPHPVATALSPAAQPDLWTIAGTLDAPIVSAPAATPALEPTSRGGVPSASVSR